MNLDFVGAGAVLAVAVACYVSLGVHNHRQAAQARRDERVAALVTFHAHTPTRAHTPDDADVYNPEVSEHFSREDLADLREQGVLSQHPGTSNYGWWTR